MDSSTIQISEQIEHVEAILKKFPGKESLKEVVAYLEKSNPDWDWVGVYLLYGDTLKLGPYVGEPTEHTDIKIGHGVCGVAVQEDQNQIIDDVNKLDNYIACSTGTKSEIVVLIKDKDQILGQFDIDSDRKGAFSSEDEFLLSQLAKLVVPAVKEVLS